VRKVAKTNRTRTRPIVDDGIRVKKVAEKSMLVHRGVPLVK
jgi:hypothetical protein